MHRLVCLVALFPWLLAAPGWSETSEREKTLCGPMQERLMFQLWSMQAPEPEPDKITEHPGIERAEFEAGDGTVLRGYRFHANSGPESKEPSKGYLLAAMGNAMVSDSMILALGDYASAGYDVYVYDYRGYGDSDGRRRLGAMIEDYKEITAQLNRQYERRLLYGISFGGVIIMNVIGEGREFDAAVIDSSPSRLSPHGCPEWVDPIHHLTEENAQRILVITGDQDSVLGDEMTSPLRDRAEALGASVYRGRDFAHPFMDEAGVHTVRSQLVRSHLLKSE